jgi:hypothetical protein
MISKHGLIISKLNTVIIEDKLEMDKNQQQPKRYMGYPKQGIKNRR